MKRFIEKAMLPALFWSYIWFVIIGIYVKVNEIAALQHGYRCLGIEDIIFLILIIAGILRKAAKHLS